MPWNSPLLLLSWKLAPALAAGCTVVAKPSDYSPASAVELAGLFEEAGFPPGVFNVVTGFGPAVGRPWPRTPAWTRSRSPGRPGSGAEVAKAAAANITGTLLELGGKSAQIVFADADLDAAGNGVVAGRVRGHRADLHGRVAAARAPERARRAGRTGSCGGPTRSSSATRATRPPRWGRWPTEPQYEKVLSFFSSAAAEGATVAAGGAAAGELGGFFVQPTVLTGVTPDMTVACEEVFGPVLAVMPFDTEDEALTLANDTRYGLAGAVWTKDVHRGAPGRARGCGPAPCGSTPTGWSARTCRSAAYGQPASAGRTASTRSTSTPRPRRSGSS